MFGLSSVDWAGVDRMSVERFAQRRQHYLAELAQALRDGSYRGSMPFSVERNDLISSWPERTDGRADG